MEALEPKRGHIDLGLYATTSQIGGALKYEHRVNEAWAAYAEAQGGYDLLMKEMYGAAYLGIRGSF